MNKITGILSVCLLVSVGAQAATVVWDGSESIYWGNPDNWGVGYLPGATAVDSTIQQTADKPITVATNFSVTTFGTDITIRSGSTLNVGADFLNWDVIRLGNNGGHYGLLNHSAGTVGAASVTIGNSGTAAANSVYTMSGGTLSATTQIRAYNQGEFNQSAGTATAANLDIDAGGSVTVSGTAALTATTIGVDATTTMTQTGGTVGSTTAHINGTYGLSGSGALNATTLNVNDTLNQSGTSVATVNTLDVDAAGIYNLTGGTLATEGTASTVDGLMDINGGTLSIDNGPADVIIGGTGLLKLQSGTLEATGSAPADVLTFNTAIEVSGGAVDLLGQIRVNNQFDIIGDAATIDIARLSGTGGGGKLNFVFDESGVSTIDVSAWMTLSLIDLEVDGSAYTGSGTSFVLLDAVNNTANLQSYNITGFGTEGVDWELVQTLGTGGSSADVVLNVIPEPATLGLITVFGGAMLFIRRRFLI
jgi:hypothetical protein